MLSQWLNNNPTIVVVTLVVFFLLLPRRFDPAIRLKEWMIKKGWSRS